MNNQPSVKQYIPIYGIYKICKDNIEGKPTLIDNYDINFVGASLGHTWGIIGAGEVIARMIEYF